MTQPPSPSTRLSRHVRWLAAAAVLVAIIVVPFLLLGQPLELWSTSLLNSPENAAGAALAGATLLAADVFLPVPSSIVLTMLGSALGIAWGTLVGALGMSLGCLVAYVVGSALGPVRAERFVSRDEQARLARGIARRGMIVLAACRAVPILAEASILAAGILRLPVRHVALTTTLANLGIAGSYAVLGATLTESYGLVAAFAASIALPALVLAMTGAIRRGARQENRYAG